MSADCKEQISEALALSERRRTESQRLSGVGFWELDHVAQTLYWSEEIFSIYGIDPNAFEPNYEIFASLIFDKDREMVESAYQDSVDQGTEYDIRYRIKYAESFRWIEAKGVTYYDEQRAPLRSIGTAQDISEMVASQERNEFLASHDPLTGLPNRILFSDRLNQAMGYAERHNTQLAILFIDLDHFKEINDQHGHEIGDQILTKLAKLLSSSARSYDTFARFGGDEFVGLMPMNDRQDINSLVDRVKDMFDCQIDTDVGPLKIAASVGVTIFPDDHDDADALLRHADHAMYQAKEEGRSRVHFFDSREHHSTVSRYELLQQIEQALDDGQFELYYQPRLALKTGELVGAEVLLRWFRDGKLVPTSSVISAIVNTELELRLDLWVFSHLLSNLNALRENWPKLEISINFNQNSIENPDLPAKLEELLTANRQSAQGLEIEILEYSSIDDFSTTNKILKQCKQLGFATSLDDFGTGYSSLTYFHALPIDIVKIDQRFIKNLLDPESLGLTKSVLALANANDRPVVAEGVETMPVAKKLAELGCDYAQGYGIARPMPLKRFQKWAQDWNPQQFLDEVNV